MIMVLLQHGILKLRQGLLKFQGNGSLSETNDVGTISFTADLSSFPAAPDPSCSQYVLLVDADGDFTNATPYDLTSIGPNIIQSGRNINH